MPIDALTLRTAVTSRKFVKRVANQIAKGQSVSSGDMQAYHDLKDFVKISKNPIKNMFNYFTTVKQIKKETAEILQMTRLKNPAQ